MTTAAFFNLKMNGTAVTVDAATADAQWARIRCASRYRPLQEQYSTYDIVYHTKPELYVVDTGINFTHPEFAGLETENFYSFNGDFNDKVGHGTAVASLAVGQNLGIARNSKLVSVKIADADSEASIEDVASALDAIIARASLQNITRIVNISWELPKSEIIDAKVQSLIDLGVTVVCSSGDAGVDLATCSPQNLANAIVVGSSDKYDIPSGYNNIVASEAGIVTNFGTSLTVFAPGEDIVVADNATGYLTASSSAFAAALVSGIACEIAAINTEIINSSTVKQYITNSATSNVLLFDVDSQGVQRFADSQNLLAYIFSSDPNANYKTKNMSMYLGVHDDAGKDISFDINSSVNTEELVNFYKTAPVYDIEWKDSQLQAVYGEYVTVNAATGCVTVKHPNVVLAEDTKLQMVSFVGTAQIGDVKIATPTFFFFHANPIYKDTQQTDITAALTDTNSVSHFNYWGFYLK